MDPENRNECRQEHSGDSGRKRHGPSSAWLHEPQTVFRYVPLKEGHVFVDLGCGAGDYTLEAAKIVGTGGKVYALDKWQYLIDNLSKTAGALGLSNITTLTADITGTLPLQDSSVDVVFIATVLHIFDLKKVGSSIFSELYRILKPDGCLAVVECKKEDQSFGPPKHLRNAPEDIEAVAAPCGFKRINFNDLGYNYLIQFNRRRKAQYRKGLHYESETRQT